MDKKINDNTGLDKYWEENYRRSLEYGGAYFGTGYTMLAAAEVLFRQTCRNRKEFFRKNRGKTKFTPGHWKKTKEESLLLGFLPATLLLALAIENFIKDYYCCIDRTLRARDSKIPKKLGKHDLVKLFIECNIQLTDKEKLLLEYLHAHLVWRGRYTIPKDSKEYAKYYSSNFEEIEVYKSFEKNNKFSPEVVSILKKLGVRYRGI